MILFSETRSARGRCVLDGGHLLYTSEIATQAAGVAILLHSKYVPRVVRVTSFNDRFMFLDLHYGPVVFDSYSFPYIFPMLDVQWRTCELCMNMLHVVLDEAERLHYKVIVGGDFNIELRLGH